MSNQPENQPQPLMAKLAPVGLPLRDEPRGEKAYGALQLDVDARLDINENPYPSSDDLIAGLMARMEGVASNLNRYLDRDAVAPRGALTDYVTRQTGVDIIINQARAVNGSNEIPQQLLQAFGGPGCNVMDFVPSYSMHPIPSSGAWTEFIGIDRNPETFDIDMDSALAVITGHRPDVIFITTPSNPTSNLTTLADLRRIARAAPSVIIVDKVYAEFAEESSAITLLAEFPSKLVAPRTVGEALDSAGGHPGYFITNPAFIDAAMLAHLPYCLSALTQVAATVAFRHPDATPSAIVKLTDKRDRVVAILNSYSYDVADSYSNLIFLSRFADAATAWQSSLDGGVLIRGVGMLGRPHAAIGLFRENDALLAVAKKSVATTLAQAKCCRYIPSQGEV